MSEQMKPVTTWVLVADGARARVYQNNGPGRGLTETQFPAMVGSHEPTRSINADRPGRMQAAPNAPAHAMDHSSDPHREQKRVFAKDVAAFLKQQAQKNAFDRLVLVAPAKTLGDLRDALDGMVVDKVTGEVAKDLTHYNARELPQHLHDVIAL
jgi:protein required for attachment to host cells